MNNNRTQQLSLGPTEQVYALILDSDGNALVRQVWSPHNVFLHWSMLKASLADHQDPMKVARDALFALGFESANWIYLGSYTNVMGRVIHFLFARDAQATSSSLPVDSGVDWVSLRDLRHALLDGRIGQISDATSVALAMYLMSLTLNQNTAVSTPLAS